MNAEKLEKYRVLLEELAARVREDLVGTSEQAGIVELDTAIGRLARMDAMQGQQMALELKSRQEQQLLRIDRALKAIAKGSYGICGRCRKPIADGRLSIQPDAVMCLKCAGG
jgi:DnaK suppressor protein